MEFGFYRLKQYRPSVVCRSVTIVIPAKTDTVCIGLGWAQETVY